MCPSRESTESTDHIQSSTLQRRATRRMPLHCHPVRSAPGPERATRQAGMPCAGEKTLCYDSAPIKVTLAQAQHHPPAPHQPLGTHPGCASVRRRACVENTNISKHCRHNQCFGKVGRCGGGLQAGSLLAQHPIGMRRHTPKHHASRRCTKQTTRSDQLGTWHQAADIQYCHMVTGMAKTRIS